MMRNDAWLICHSSQFKKYWMTRIFARERETAAAFQLIETRSQYKYMGVFLSPVNVPRLSLLVWFGLVHDTGFRSLEARDDRRSCFLFMMAL